MLKILYTSDIHAHPSHLTAMLAVAEELNVRAVIIGGDIIPHHLPDTPQSGILNAQSRYLAHTFLPAVTDYQKETGASVYFDLGNDDFRFSRRILEPLDGEAWHLIHMAKRPLTPDVDIIGYMNVPPTPFGRKDWEKPDAPDRSHTPENRIQIEGCVSTNGRIERCRLDLDSSDTIASDLEKLSEKIDRPFIFVSHSPPLNTPLDVIYSGLHVGSLAIRRFIEHWAEKGMILASLHGHIHESPERSGAAHTEISGCPCLNPGQESRAVFRYAVLGLERKGGKTRIRCMEGTTAFRS